MKTLSKRLREYYGKGGMAEEAADELDRLTARVAELEAQLDRVMLEHCPDEMSTEQKERWAKHQAALEHKHD